MRADAVRQLHNVGVHHGQLYERIDSLCISDGRHFLRAAEGTIRIVDFQWAQMHQCDGKRDSIGSRTRRSSYSTVEAVNETCTELVIASEHSKNCPQGVQGLLKKVPWNAF